MKITLRQRAFLRVIKDIGEVSERRIHNWSYKNALKVVSLIIPSHPPLQEICWSNVDKRFPREFGVFSNELHEDIEDMVKKGYIFRNYKNPLLITAKKGEFLYGVWFSGRTSENFLLAVNGKRHNGDVEEIGGEILDSLGLASFWGKRHKDRIEFIKLYDPFSSPDAPREETLYQGKLEKRVFHGTYNYMDRGEIPVFGEFVLARRIRNLSG